MSTWHTQAEVDALVRDRVSEQLRKDIAAYNGAPAAAKDPARARGGLHDEHRPSPF